MRTRLRAAEAALRVLTGLVLAGMVSGCVSLPTSGSVEQVPPRGAEVDVLVQVVPSGPQVGATPAEVVTGFLTANEAFPVSTSVARDFLTPRAAERWDPGRRTVVYTTSSLADVQVTAPRGSVGLRTLEVARLDTRGTYHPVPTGRSVRRTLDVVRTDSGWRISDPPSALLLSAGYFEEYFRPHDLYFFDPTGAALVPDPVWLPLGDQLTTDLAEGLLAGPTRWLRGQAVTTVSAKAGVRVSAPLGTDGIVDVSLSEAVTGLSGSQRERLSAQLVWTLSQASGVEGVQVSAAGAPLAVPGVEQVQSTASWQEYDPSDPAGLGARTQLFGVRQGHVVAVDADAMTRLSGWWGGRQRQLGEISVEATLDRVAGTDRSRQLVRVGPYTSEPGDISTWYETDGTLHDPQWDRTGQLWVLERTSPAKGTQLVVLNAGRPTALPVLGGLPPAVAVRSFALSADGARIALLVDRWTGRWRGGVREPPVRGPVLVVARVVRGPSGRIVRRLDRAYAVPMRGSGLAELAAPAWGGPSQLSLLGRLVDEPVQVYRVAIDGSSIEGGILSGEAVLGPVGAVDLTASGVTGAEPVVGDRRGRLFALDGEADWAQFAENVRHPRYPD